MKDLVTNFIYKPILAALLFFDQLTGNFGLAIILLTLTIRLILVPITMPGMKMSVKMRDLQPEINKLKEKYKGDKAGMQQAQLELFKKHQVNPAAGCLPLVAQFIILIVLYNVFTDLLSGKGSVLISSTQFLWMDLTKPDPYYIMPILAGLTQLILSLMILPASSTAAEKTLAVATPTKKDDHKADDMGEMAATMQKQMVFLMPVMTVIIALRFPSGLALYWIVSTLFSIGQQYFVSGWGALPDYTARLFHRRKLLS
jgi:YidC/Oxa1 family membrane protein insertase